MSLLDIRNLGVTFHMGETGSAGGDVYAVRGADLDVERGDTVALVGESGCGKSVTALSVLQLLPYPRASHPHGSICFEGDELLGAAPNRLRELRGNRISMIFQEPMTSLNPLHTVERQIGEALILHRGMDRAQARDHTLELLERVRLPHAGTRLQSWPHQLSGGQRQRVMIAMALANQPDLLIADEPTTALDVTIQAQILELLKELQQDLGMAILLITHDLTMVRSLADRVFVMTEGRIVEHGPSERLFDHPQHPYTRTLLDAELIAAPPPVPEQAPCLETDLPGSRSPTTQPTPPVLRAGGLQVRFPIKRGLLRRTKDWIRAVDGLTLEVRAGQTLGVVGESGSGKTTLGLALLRLISSQGTIEFEGRAIQGLRSKELRPLRRHMQIVFQDPYSSLSPRLSAFDIVEEGLRVHGMGGTYEERRHLVAEALVEVGLDPATMERYPHEFSGGQRQRLAIARAIVLQPRLIILDEPTSALDRTVQSRIVRLLRDLQEQRQLAYLFISHDLRVVRAMAHYIIVMKDGAVVEEGAAEQVLDRPEHEYTRALMAAALGGQRPSCPSRGTTAE